MRVLYFLFFFFVVSNTVSGQQGIFKPGSVTKIDGTVIQGSTYLTTVSERQFLRLKINSGEIIDLSADDVATCRVGNDNYVTKAVIIAGSAKKYFLQPLLKGTTSLHLLLQKNQPRLFIAERNDSLSVISPSQTLGYLIFFFGDCSKQVFHANTRYVYYSDNELIRIFLDYNACSGSTSVNHKYKSSKFKIYAQFGLRGGAARNTISFLYDARLRDGFLGSQNSFVGITTNINTGGRLSLQADLLRIDRGSSTSTEVYYGDTFIGRQTIPRYLTNIRQNHWQIDLSAKYLFIASTKQRLLPYILVGPSLLTSAQLNQATYTYTIPYVLKPSITVTDLSNEFTRDVFGLHAGAGVGLKLSSYLHLMSDVQYYSFKNRSSSKTTLINRSWLLSFGILFGR